MTEISRNGEELVRDGTMSLNSSHHRAEKIEQDETDTSRGEHDELDGSNDVQEENTECDDTRRRKEEDLVRDTTTLNNSDHSVERIVQDEPDPSQSDDLQVQEETKRDEARENLTAHGANPTRSRSPPQSSNNYWSPVRPIVEWVYPNGVIDRYEGESRALSGENRRETVEEASVMIVINPRDVETPLEVTGVIANDQQYLCDVILCGVRICRKSSQPKSKLRRCLAIFCLIAVIVVIISTVAYVFWPLNKVPNKVIPTSTSSIPSLQPSFIPSIFLSSSPSTHPSQHPRTVNITNVIFEVSRHESFINSSPQNLALNWIIYEDTKYLSFDDPTLIQRYTLMVIYYTLSGSSWKNNEGYGSGVDECNWFGVSCDFRREYAEVTSLNYDLNGLRGQIPNEIGLLRGLSELRMRSNDIEGSLPTSLWQLEYLTMLLFGTSRLTGTISSKIGYLRKLKKLSFDENSLSGSLPSSIGELKRLDVLRIDQNLLTGTIPSEIGDMDLLREIYLYSNELNGTLPETIVNLGSLEDLYLDGNNLSGSLPSNLDHLVSLEKLYLSDNKLTGTIPSEIGTLLNLEILSLRSSKMTGTVPSEIGNMKSLRKLELDGNDFTGTIPEILCDMSLDVFLTDCVTNC